MVGYIIQRSAVSTIEKCVAVYKGGFKAKKRVKKMCSELECGICYSVYNMGRRCPRELRCGHTFCEICLVTLSQPPASEGAGVLGCLVEIVCPLCRSSSVLGAEGVRHALRVDEEVLGRILASGVLEMCSADDGVSDDEDNGEGGEKNYVENTCPVVEGDTAPRSRKGKLWRSVKRFCGRLIGDSSHNFRRRVNQCMTEADMRDLALMSCYMM
ncbi:hypothetical protein AAFF_G00325080 [Aldrovandia affinis]|uniref:RING-type domain-containing protein n=1 Tax=Aldrovandia affinis TaxID=143900 RepID=A0AAD7T930_9TELE|nr:hypothetical protein AAFF_G00325080 [Aldrovandia affinis]